MRPQNLPPLIMPAPQRILLRGLNWLGDAVMATPALLRLRQALPAARLSLLLPEKLAALWEHQPFLDDVLPFSPSDTLWQVSRRLRARRFTAALAFPNSLRAALELWLARIPRRVGAARPGRNLFLTTPVAPLPHAVPMRKRSLRQIRQLIAGGAPPPPIPALSHHVYHYLHLAGALGASTEPLPPRLDVAEDQMDEVRRKFGLARDGAAPWFGLNPGAEYGPAKRWPTDRFAAAAVALQKETNCRWLIFGGPADKVLAEKVTTEIRFAGSGPDCVLNLAGKTSLRELTAALKLCRLLLTNDSGPMHLAAAIGTPVVAIFGSTSPELTGPGIPPGIEVVRNPPLCAPCFRRECPIDLRCMNDISIGQVVEAARHILDS